MRNSRKIASGLVSLGVMAMTLPIFADSAMAGTAATPPVTSKAACVMSAVDTRDASVAPLYIAFGQAMSDAVNARKAALDAAYSAGDAKTRKAAVKAAWATFRVSVKAARTTLNTGKKTAWTSFKSTAKACHATGVPVDSASQEAQ